MVRDDYRFSFTDDLSTVYGYHDAVIGNLRPNFSPRNFIHTVQIHSSLVLIRKVRQNSPRYNSQVKKIFYRLYFQYPMANCKVKLGLRHHAIQLLIIQLK